MSAWMAVNHVGKFRKGEIYTSEQLGVLGRMAVYSGHLIPHVEQMPSARPRKKPSQSVRRKKGWADGEPSAAEPVPGTGDSAEDGDFGSTRSDRVD